LNPTQSDLDQFCLEDGEIKEITRDRFRRAIINFLNWGDAEEME